jgi:hypothetical protein
MSVNRKHGVSLEADFVHELLARICTEALRRGDVPTVALVVVNASEITTPPSRVRFSAGFPTSGPKPVTVRDDRGEVVPSRIVSQSVYADAIGISSGRVLWSLVLEFAVPMGLHAHTARAFGASYEESESAQSGALLDALPLADLPVYETDCHVGAEGLVVAL